ncbi:hypothetical protein FPQ18DRAFT_319913, partial [Pyronema domesticum]
FLFYASLLYEVLLYVLLFFGIVCISFVIVGIETTTESRQQMVEPPGRMGYVRCWELRRLRALGMLGHSVGNVWSCIVCLLHLGITAARRITKEWSCIDGTFSAGRECWVTMDEGHV